MLAKPIARGEVLLYRMLGYIGITWPFILAVCILCLITGFTGPSDSLFRWEIYRLDVNCLGCHAGFFGIWNNLLWIWNSLEKWCNSCNNLRSMGIGNGICNNTHRRRLINSLHVCHWMGDDYCRCGAAIGWPDNWQLIEIGLWGGGHGEEELVRRGCIIPLPGAEPLSVFSGSPNLGVSNWLAFVISTMVLIFQGIMAWFIGQTIFKGKEVN